MDIQYALDFLSDLAKNNKKEWMDDNKKRYQQAKTQVIELVAELIQKSATFTPTLTNLDPRKTLFRINRDVRFSKNKDPYKTNFGAAIVEGGKKSNNPEFYLHLMPQNSFVGGGIYQPSSEMLQKIRQEIDYNGQEIRNIIENKTFKKTFGTPYGDGQLKTAPRGYPKDHENIELLRLKHYVFMQEVTDQQVTGKDFADKATEIYKTLHPFNLFLTKALN